jgi:hypothetical protein
VVVEEHGDLVPVVSLHRSVAPVFALYSCSNRVGLDGLGRCDVEDIAVAVRARPRNWEWAEYGNSGAVGSSPAT